MISTPEWLAAERIGALTTTVSYHGRELGAIRGRLDRLEEQRAKGGILMKLPWLHIGAMTVLLAMSAVGHISPETFRDLAKVVLGSYRPGS